MEENKKFKLTDQFIGAIMMTLQKALIEQIDITQIMRDFVVEETEEGLVVLNPPTFTVSKE